MIWPLLFLLSCHPGPTPIARRPCQGWRLAQIEDFEALPMGQLGAAPWRPDDFPDDGPYAERGAYFAAAGIAAPPGFRAELAFGKGGWLTASAYAQGAQRPFDERLTVVADPAGPGRALRLRSPLHTDATIVRGSAPLPRRYRLSLRVGYADFGDGRPGRNGYDSGEEWAGPWKARTAVDHNGFYWLAILDHRPLPHNNIWIHHHRKVVIDSCNHFPPWMEIFDGQRFVPSGERPVMMFVLDGTRPGREQSGALFRSLSAQRWQPLGAVRAVDSYLPRRWYRASISRDGDRFALRVAGDFAHGGDREYAGQIDAAEVGVFHYKGPDYFFLGDPHINYYEGEVLYDDIALELPEECPPG